MKRRRPGRPDAALVTTPESFNAAWLKTHLRGLIGPLARRRICVAWSGGMDSTALLSALVTLRTRTRFELRAIHINHQLQPQAARWERAARALARKLQVKCKVIKVRIAKKTGESPEGAARDARYQALARDIAAGELLLTAHHLEDQLETVLLALVRGSGVNGLSAMAAVTPWAGTSLVRPLLPVHRSQLERFARRRQLEWSEDPSNLDERFDRNYLRRVVLPTLTARWPSIARTVSRSAANLSEARAILEHLGRDALMSARDGDALRVTVLRRLTAPYRRNAVRQWIAERGLPAPDQRRLREICGPLLAAREDAQAQVCWSGVELRRHADRLHVRRSEPQEAIIAPVRQWDWRSTPWLSLGAVGTLGIVRDPHGDVQLKSLPAMLSVRFRSGGERLRASAGSVPLKDLLQRLGVAPWKRSALPLIVHGERIVAVADLWLDQHYAIRDSGRDPGNAERGRFRWRREPQRKS